MPVSKKSPPRKSATVVSTLAAKLLGHSRVSSSDTLTSQQISIAFPNFNAMELDFAINELIDKQFFTQKGLDQRASYTLTDLGRNARVSVG